MGERLMMSYPMTHDVSYTLEEGNPNQPLDLVVLYAKDEIKTHVSKPTFYPKVLKCTGIISFAYVDLFAMVKIGQ